MHALIVDDSAHDSDDPRPRISQKLGFDVTEAVNGRDGLEQLRGMEKADVVLVDWNMPEMDGLDVHQGGPARAGYDAVPHDDGDDQDRERTGRRGARRRRQRVHDEAVHRRDVREKLELLGVSGTEPQWRTIRGS